MDKCPYCESLHSPATLPFHIVVCEMNPKNKKEPEKEAIKEPEKAKKKGK